MDQDNVKRAKNFTDRERERVVELVQEYRHIVDNKKNDKTSIRLKTEAWGEITQKYNVDCHTGPRTAKQLHALYDIIKKKAKKDRERNQIANKNNINENKNFVHVGDMSTSDMAEDPIFNTLQPQCTWVEENKFDPSAGGYFGEISAASENTSGESIPAKNDFDKPDETSKSNTDTLVISPLPSLEASNSAMSQDMPVSERKNQTRNRQIHRKRMGAMRRFVVNKSLYHKKEDIFTTELVVKEKQVALLNYDLIIKQQDLKLKEKELELKDKNIQLKNEELYYKRRMQEIELEMKEKDLEIKKWEHAMKFDEYKFYTENADYKR